MKLIRVGAAVLNQTPLAWEQNEKNIRTALAEARRRGVGVLCLPEMCITGYGCEDAFHSRSVHELALKVLGELLPETRGMVVSFGLPLLHCQAVFNTVCVAVDGKIAGFVAKRFLAGDGIHYEPRWFKPWPADVRAETEALGGIHPIGDLHFDVGGVRIGFEICEDAWVANRPGAELARQGVDLILNPSASHFAFGKLQIRKQFVIEGSRAFSVSYVYSNLVGNEAGRAIYDGGALVASGGRLVAMGPRFGFADCYVTDAVVDVDATRTAQARTASFAPMLDADPRERVRVPFAWGDTPPEAASLEMPAWETGARLKEEEFTRAEALALFDYMRKSRSEGFVLSLSGGADSSATACLISMMTELAWQELGREAFLARLGYIRRVQGARTPTEATRALLSCVYQGTRNSSAATRASARIVAEALGAEFHDFQLDGLVDGYVAMIEGAIARKLDWEADDVALQNIQARARAPGVWMLANLRNALLVSTSNRSESAVGYATMDGDTSGGIAPIAGIDKYYLRQWLRWMEVEGPYGLHPIPALRVVNGLAPGPELRPPEKKQTGEGDLMPYGVLDAIERAAIRDKHAPLECYRVLRARFPEHGPEDLLTWVRRFFKLWCRNQWKRERYAPSFHLDDENLDPKTWCRFPILSGGFDLELAELERWVAREASGA